MYIENKYKTWYYKIIDNAKLRITLPYKEKHHIQPKSLGGNNDKSNLVDLTPREHYICHLLLTKFTTGDAKIKMFYALHRLTNATHGKIKSSKIYEYLRINHSKILSEKFKSKTILELYGKQYMHEISEHQKKQISKSNSERIWSDESRLKMSKSKSKPNLKLRNVPKSKEHKENLSKSRIEKFRKQAKSYKWLHNKYGTFIGTIYDLIDLYPNLNIIPGEINKVTTGVYKSHRGWKLF